MIPTIDEVSLEFCNINLLFDRGERKDNVDVTIWDDGDIFFSKDTDTGFEEIYITFEELEKLSQLAHDFILLRNQTKKDA